MFCAPVADFFIADATLKVSRLVLYPSETGLHNNLAVGVEHTDNPRLLYACVKYKTTVNS